MKPRLASDVAEVIGGQLIGPDVEVASIITDSRNATSGALFVALVGEHADGHDHALSAMSTGAGAALVEREMDGVGSQIVVPDAIAALQALAADERRRSGATVVAVTGSTGKTLTKDLIAAAVGAGRQVHAATGSFNNEIGLPLTLLSADEDTEVIVAEMGARGVGHIADLCRIAAPDIGVVTNIGVAHLELFGSREQIAVAKGELVAALPERGLAVLNDDDPLVRALPTPATVLRVGTADTADLRATEIRMDDDAIATCVVETGGDVLTLRAPLPGEHMVHNMLAALAVALHLGVDANAAAAAIASAPTSRWRMQMHDTPGGVRVINDAYNANPTSMTAALKAARWIARERRLIAVLGTMRELGERSFEEHERVGELVARLRVEELLTVGQEALPIARAAVREGVEPEHVRSVDDAEGAAAELDALVVDGDVVILKASRAVGLERVAEAIA